jgi:hypothetical protein
VLLRSSRSKRSQSAPMQEARSEGVLRSITAPSESEIAGFGRCALKAPVLRQITLPGGRPGLATINKDVHFSFRDLKNAAHCSLDGDDALPRRLL